MTTRPELERNPRQAVGLLAFVLFGVLAAVFLTAEFGDPAGFPGDGSITAAIGYAMFNLAGGAYDSEGFLIAFEIIDIVLVTALAAAVMLARREGEGFLPLADGGRETQPEGASRDGERGAERPASETGQDEDSTGGDR